MLRKTTLAINSKKIIQLITIISFCGIFACQYLRTDQHSRKDYKHWIDVDHDCQNTRQEVLIAESLEKPVLDSKGCKVISGEWFDPYTNQYFTNPSDLDVDHFVPLAEVDRSGGHEWLKDKKMQYANDLDHSYTLIVVSKSANRSKGDKDPSDWMPLNEAYGCEYIKTWRKIKQDWDLIMDKKETDFLEKQHKFCQQ